MIMKQSLLIFAILSISIIARALPAPCSPAGNIACSTPPPSCTDPVFNAGSGGSMNCNTATPVDMPGCESCITGTTVNSDDGTTTTFPGCGAADGMVWFTYAAPNANNVFTL